MYVFFDLDGTLLDTRTATRLASLEFFNHFKALLSIAEENFPDLWEKNTLHCDELYLSRKLSFTEQRRHRIRTTFDDLSLSNVEADDRFSYYLSAYKRSWKAFLDVVPCLESLRRYASLGVITNGDAHQQRQKVRALGLEDYFSVILTSEEARAAKPSPQIFLTACALADYPPASTYYVGDNLKVDAIGSMHAGLTPIWLDRRSSGIRHKA